MRLKRVLTGVLLTFVVLALAFVVRDVRGPKETAPGADAANMAASLPEPQVVEASPSIAPAEDPPIVRSVAAARPTPEPAMPVANITRQAARPAVAKEAVPAAVHKVVATYFHGNIRCPTCRKVEAYAREAVDEGFAPQIATGAVEFRAVNVDDAANRHFIEDFQLTNKSVVVTDEVDGAVLRWVKLDEVWSLVGNRGAYVTYVQDGVRGYLETR